MRFSARVFLLVCAGVVGAQTAEDADVVRARLELLRVEGLAASGALPEAQIEKARAAVQDAEDRALLRKNIYQQDLTEAQADAMVAAASRQMDRRKQAFDDAKRLVEAAPPRRFP